MSDNSPAPSTITPNSLHDVSLLDITIISGRLHVIEKAIKHIEELLEYRTKWDSPLLTFKEGAELLHVGDGRFEAIISKYRREHYADPPFISGNQYTRRLIHRDELIKFAMGRKKRPVGRPGKETTLNPVS